MATISAAMIVRDCEGTLERALRSIRPHVDELVVVDTGSTDGTWQIAAPYADVLDSIEWRDDFSAARQYAFDQCSGDWLCWLDADDELHNGELIRPSCESAPAEAGAVYWRYVTERAPDGSPTMQYRRERAVRRGQYRWVGRCHEVLEAFEKNNYIREDRIWVEHHGHGDGSQSLARNIRILRAELAEQPEPRARTLMYLARDLLQAGRPAEALPLLEEYLPRSTWDDERYLAQLMIAYIYRLDGRHEDALGEDLAALLIKADWPDAYYALAEDYYHLGEWARVKTWSEIGQRMPIPDTEMFVAPRAYSHGWMLHYATALAELGDYAGCLAVTQRALQQEPGDPRHRRNLLHCAKKLAEGAMQQVGA
jgi:glycosyltransferase involved in cell wall biosynthesis